MLSGPQKELFNEAYKNYQTIIATINAIYNCSIIKDSTKLPPYESIVALTDIFIQNLLLKIAYSDNIISNNELDFIIGIPDHLNFIKEIEPDYIGLIRAIKSNDKQYKKYKELDVIGIFGNKPLYLALSLEAENITKDNNTDILVENTEKICLCFSAVEDSYIPEETDIIASEIRKLKEYKSTDNYLSDLKMISDTGNGNNVSTDNEIIVLDKLLDELNELIGLNVVKSEVSALLNLIKVNKLRKEKQLQEFPVSYHMVFTGNPGTGKTTIARLLAQIFKEMGIVSKGHLVETDRSGLVAGYIGHTALKVKSVVEEAIGGILFIDEAYALYRSDSENDFGKEAIDTLVKLMEDNRHDLIVIVAGYTGEMEYFINSNPGLASRFNKYLHFPDYNSEELLRIFQFMCRGKGMLVSEAALEKAKSDFDYIEISVDKFGNARGVRNYFEKAIQNQANRIVKMDNLTKFSLQTIEKEDLHNIIIKSY